MKKINFSFLTVGKTVEAKSDFKRYVGIGQSEIIALNPSAKQLSEIYGREIVDEPVYTGTDDETGTKWVRFEFIVKTDPEACNGIDITSRASFTLRSELYSNKENTKVRVLDNYGNSIWMETEAAKAKTVPTSNNGGSVKLSDYRIALRGEPELIDFLRKYFATPEAFEYVNGSWSLKKLKHLNELTKEEAEKDDVLTYESCMMAFDKSDFEKFFKGDVSDLWNEIADRKSKQPLAVKLLYGVSTNAEGRQFQNICTGFEMTLRKNANAKAIAYVERQLVSAKQSGMYSNVDYQVCPLKEWTVQPTNLEVPASNSFDSDLPFEAPASSGPMPWD